MTRYLPILAFLFVSCATTGGLSKLDIGMSKVTVEKTINQPHTVRGAKTNQYGQVIEVWEYELVKPEDTFPRYTTRYWIVFCDGKLAQWGQAGDWQSPDKIYEMRFR